MPDGDGCDTGSVGATDREGDALSYSVTDTPEHGRSWSFGWPFTYTQTRLARIRLAQMISSSP